MQCPVCQKEVDFKSENMPFCSDRCRLLDLGDWASEKHVISSPIHHHDFDDDLDGLDHATFEPGSGFLQ